MSSHQQTSPSYGAKLQRLERQIHHYGSGLNSLPLLSAFRADPSASNYHLLRVGHGGNQGPLSNIDQAGFAAAAFHSWPDTLAWDAYSGDYGPGFLGHVLGAATYLVRHDVYGWTAFGGNVVEDGDEVVRVEPLDVARRRVFVAPLALYVQVDAGVVEVFTYEPGTGAVVVGVRNADGGEVAASAVVTFEQTSEVGAGTVDVTTEGLERKRGGWVVPLGDEAVHEIAFGVVV